MPNFSSSHTCYYYTVNNFGLVSIWKSGRAKPEQLIYFTGKNLA